MIEGFDNNDQPLMNLLGARDEFLEIGHQNALDGFAFQPFMSFMNQMGAYSNMVASAISEKYAFALETDILGAISCIMLQRACFNSAPTFMGEFTVRHPDNENSALFWHGSAPFSMCHPDEKIKLGHHWVFKSPLSGMVHMKLKDGPFTVTRFDGDHGLYKLALGEGKTTEGPKTQNCYFWAEVDNWTRWERILMEGPFIHHVAMAYGNYGKALVEACKYIPSLEPVILNEKI
jgi:L-fucose isomerase-like protein